MPYSFLNKLGCTFIQPFLSPFGVFFVVFLSPLLKAGQCILAHCDNVLSHGAFVGFCICFFFLLNNNFSFFRVEDHQRSES